MEHAMQKVHWKNSLKTRMGLSLFIIITLILALFGIYQYSKIKTNSLQELHDVAEITIDRLAENLASPIWQLDTPQIVNILNSEMREKRIYAIVVKENITDDILQARTRGENWEIVGLASEDDLGSNAVMKAKDVIKNDETIGRVHLYVTQKFMRAQLQRSIMETIISMVIIDLAALGFALFITFRVTRSLEKLVSIANAIAAGHVGQTIQIQRNDEIGQLAEVFRNMQDTIGHVMQETDTLLHAIQQGQLETRGNADAFSGGWRELVTGVNAVVEAFVTPVNMASEVLKRISRGDIPARISQEYAGDFNKIKDHLNALIDSTNETIRLAEEIAEGNLTVEARERSENDRLMKALNAMIKGLNMILHEMDSLVQTVQEGKLDTRGDADAFSGGWRELVVGVNSLIDAFVQPIMVTALYIDRVAKGDIPEQITEEYQGDFNEIKHNLNSLIETMSSLLSETNDLIVAVRDGKLTVRGKADQFVGDWRTLVEGINELISAFVAPITMTARALDRIAQGDIPDKITDEYQGDFNEIKDNLNTLIETMQKLLDETRGLILAVQEGKLSHRGKTSHFVGDWRELVVGMNNVLDAFMAPIAMTAEALDRISQGDIPDPIAETYQGDFNEMKHNLNILIDAMNEITQLAEQMAAGNLTLNVKERSEQDKLMRALNAMIRKLHEMVISVKVAADNVTEVSLEMTTSSEKMSHGATQQAAAAEQASSSMQEMAANIRQNADNALQTEKIALKSAEGAREGGNAVTQTVSAMRQIAKKISIIEDIAGQTRLLSLNATIEAARAQEHGKGFAVVASEVRNLADQSRLAAEEINDLATSSVNIAEKAGDMLNRLIPDIERTAELVQEISAASSEQSSGSEQINRAIQQLDQVIQQNAASSEEMVSTAESLASQAEQLQTMMSFFHIAEAKNDAPGQEKRIFEKKKPSSSEPVPAQKESREKKHQDSQHSPKKKQPEHLEEGYLLEMQADGNHKDHKDHYDDEFERF